jgi:hypothetical protein
MIDRLFFASIAFVVWFAAGLCEPVSAQSTAGERASQSSCKNVAESGPYQIFADTSASEKPKWKRFASESELEKHRETQETFTIAKVGTENGRVRSAYFNVFFESGDHAKYVTHCFRTDGTLASAIVEFRTFYGYYILIDDMEFDTAGKKTRSTRTVRDLGTSEPKVVKAELISDLQNLIDGDVYKKVSRLPFAALLKKN